MTKGGTCACGHEWLLHMTWNKEFTARVETPCTYPGCKCEEYDVDEYVAEVIRRYKKRGV